MKIIKYPDGSSYAVLEPGDARWNGVFKINSYEDLWHLNQYVEVYNNIYKQAPEITIPNLIDAQADRRFVNNQSSGLKLVCQFLNNMNAHFKIFHPHNPEVAEALIDNVQIIDNKEFIVKTINKIALLDNYDNDLATVASNVILMSSDAGGFKPLMKLCDQIKWEGETYSATKARTENGMKQLIDRDDFKGKDILIIDDICVKGGTFKGLAKMLRERNVGKLYLAVSHMTLQQLGNDPVTNHFDKVFTTNSKYDEYFHYQPGHVKNLEIIKLF